MSDKKKNIIVVFCILCIMVSVFAFIIIYYDNKHEEFIYNEHLEETVVTVKKQGEEESIDISLQEMTYYIINVEGDIQDMALQYNSSNPEAYWLLKVDSLYNMKDYAKDLSMDSCVRDNIYYMEALKQGIELTEEELQLASEDARTIIKNITSKQMNVSEFTIEALYNIERKLYLASKYVGELVRKGYTPEELELKGTYYEELRAKYDIVVNNKLWDEIRLGDITISN